MSMFSMPRMVRLRLKQIQRDFLWGGGALERNSFSKVGDFLLRRKEKGIGI